MTISGSVSAHANAQRTGSFVDNSAGGSATNIGQVLANFMLPRSYSFVIQVTVNENPAQGSEAHVSINDQIFGPGSSSGVLPASFFTQSVGGLARALAIHNNNVVVNGSSGSATFTLTLTPQ